MADLDQTVLASGIPPHRTSAPAIMEPTKLDRAAFEAWSAAVQGPNRRSSPVLPGQGPSLACFSADPQALDLTRTGLSTLALINGTAGSDFIHRSGDGLVAPVGYNEVLGVTTGDDSLFGGDGDDILHGDAGRDLLDGGAGADVMIGGLGNDTYYVDDPDDLIIEAGGGRDRVVASVDYILRSGLEELRLAGRADLSGVGSDSANILTGNRGDNDLEGLAGNDRLEGGDGDDNLSGGDGADILIGGQGADILAGGLGDDSYTWSADDPDILIEGPGGGYDQVWAYGSFTMGDHFERLYLIGAAGAFTDGMGNDLGNTIRVGSQGRYELQGLGGDDDLQGADLDDFLDGGSGADIMAGGGGNDTYIVDDPGDLVIEQEGRGKSDVVIAYVSFQLPAHVDDLILAGVENLQGFGNGRLNLMDGNAGANLLSGGKGNDVLYGQGGDDLLDGGQGSDHMVGGAGHDTYMVDSTGDLLSEQGGDGVDTVLSSISFSLGVDFENLTLSGIGDLSGEGNGLDNILIGNDGQNVMIGGAGADSLNGQQGDDILQGGDGDDSLVGAQGVDLLTGDAGSDRFVFKTPGGTAVGFADTITDFSQADSDRIDLQEMDANTTLAGNQAFTLGGSSFSGLAGELIQKIDGTGRTVLQGDINGDEVADFEILLAGGPLLAQGDFLL